MDWKEYEEAAAEFFKEPHSIWTVKKNIRLPDKVTGQKRQVDTLLVLNLKGHEFRVLVDAKFHKDMIDVTHVEGVSALADAVGADKSIIVCPNGWTKPAEKKAKYISIGLELITIEQAVRLLNEDMWKLCPLCENDCIIMNHEGAVISDEMVLWWLAGQCRECKGAVACCQDCGDELHISPMGIAFCNCGHRWRADSIGMFLKRFNSAEEDSI